MRRNLIPAGPLTTGPYSVDPSTYTSIPGRIVVASMVASPSRTYRSSASRCLCRGSVWPASYSAKSTRGISSLPAVRNFARTPGLSTGIPGFGGDTRHSTPLSSTYTTRPILTKSLLAHDSSTQRISPTTGYRVTLRHGRLHISVALVFDFNETRVDFRP